MNSDCGPDTFSVVIPLYNKSGEIERCLRSVLAQTYADFQVIVVDDGSSDDSADKVRGFDDPRIALILQSNGGVAAARNTGIAAAGEWVAFLDADDSWSKDHLQNLASLREKFPTAQFLFTAYDVKRGTRQRTVKLSGKAMHLVDYLTIPDGMFVPSCMAITRSALDTVGGYREMFGEDVDITFRVGALYQAAYSHDATATWHLDAENRRCDDEAAATDKYKPGSLSASMDDITRLSSDKRLVDRAIDYVKRRESKVILKTIRSGDKQHALYLYSQWQIAFQTQDARLNLLLKMPVMIHRRIGALLNFTRQVGSAAGYMRHRLVPSPK